MTTKNLNKKSSKRVRATVVVPPLNKTNATKFGDQLYSDKGGLIQCIAMCSGELQNGKVGGRTTHCAVGEVYHVFVNPSLRKVLSEEENSEDSTAAAIEAIVQVAKLKDDSDAGREELQIALNGLVGTNDYFNLSGSAAYVVRAEAVQRTWRESVVPLLK
jgi:hypothetical protein